MTRETPLPLEVLALAVCHELGNNLAAMRMLAHTSEKQPGPPANIVQELATASESWLGQLRALLRPPQAVEAVGPHALQQVVATALSHGPGVAITAASGLPVVLIAPQILAEQVAFLTRSLANGDPGCELRIECDAEEVQVRLALPRASPDLSGPEPSAPGRGLRLAIQTSRAILARHGLGLTRAQTGDAVVVHVPAHDA